MKTKFLIYTLLTTFLLCFVSSMNATEVYKKVDENGRVIFSDTPHEGAKLIKVEPVTTYPAPNVSNSTPQVEPNETSRLTNISYKIAITHPEPNSFIANQGPISVDISVSPDLHQSHEIQLLLDGEKYGSPQSGTQFNVSDLNNGSHTLQAIITEKLNSSKILAQSLTIQIHTRQSFLNNPTLPKAPQMPKMPQAPIAPRAP